MKIAILPDCQVKPDTPTDHIAWAAKYFVEKKPDVIVCLGDFWDMPSLSTHDKVGSKYFEGKRYKADVEAGNEAMRLFTGIIKAETARLKKNKEKQWKPRMVFLKGNHCARIERCIQNNPLLEGTIGYQDLFLSDWEVHDFLHPVTIGGVVFSHYFPTGALGRPASTASAMVTKLHQSCIAGHQQGRQVAYGKRADGTPITCIIAGSYYQHDEHYMSVTGNKHWRGLVVLHEVQDGTFDEMFVSLDYLKKKYDHQD